MVLPEVVTYLQENLAKHKLADLRQQLASEGVIAADFDDSLQAARKALALARRRTAGRMLMGIGALVIVGAALAALLAKKPAPAPAPTVSSDRGFIGRSGYVIRLPDGYIAVKSSDAQMETVHFCKAGTDPTNLLDPELFGPLGIVRLQVRANSFGEGLSGLAALTQYATTAAQNRGEKYTLKNVQVSSLRGIQMDFQDPGARVETYIISNNLLYSFLAGQDDSTYQTLLNSLHDPEDADGE